MRATLRGMRATHLVFLISLFTRLSSCCDVCNAARDEDMMALLSPRVFMGTRPTGLQTMRPVYPSLFMITRPVGLQTMRPTVHKFGIAVVVSKQKAGGDDNIRKARRAVWKLDERGSNDVNSGNAGGDSKTLGDVANYDYDINDYSDFVVPALDVSLTNMHVSKVKQEDRSIYFNGSFHKLIHLHRLPEGEKTPEIGNVWCATIKDLVSGEVSKLNFKNKSLTLKKDIVMVAKDEVDVEAYVEYVKSGKNRRDSYAKSGKNSRRVKNAKSRKANSDAHTLGDIPTYDYDFKDHQYGLGVTLIGMSVTSVRDELRSIYYDGGFYRLHNLGKALRSGEDVWCITAQNLISEEFIKLFVKTKPWVNHSVWVAKDEDDVQVFVDLMKLEIEEKQLKVAKEE